MTSQSVLVPLLVVRGAARAIDFYVRAFGARVLARYEHGPERYISHADLAFAGASFAVAEEARAWTSDAPASLGGSPVVLQLHVADADASLASLRAAGATSVFPAEELLGERMARVRDPFGHLWILRQRLRELSTDEIQLQRDELFARIAGQQDTCTLAGSPASRQSPNRTGRIHLVVGPVGAGKSTFALGLARDHAALRLTLDEWMAKLFGADRPDTGVMEWYVERTTRCID